MSVSPSFRAFVLEQLERVVPDIRARSMFGGVGLYAGDLFFAVVDDDTIYFKVDDTNRGMFEHHGMEPFQPGGPGGEVMQYYQVPEAVLEDVDELRVWIESAVAVARSRKKRPRK
ncbi:MAG: TfoX/Sxy family protein [Gemmatimonadota bacterium]